MSDKFDLILEELKSFRTEVNSKFESHEKMITQLLQIVGATNAKVSNLDNKVSNLEKSVDEIKTTIGTISETQEEQNDLFDTIARRSIEHETKIKKLQASKRII